MKYAYAYCLLPHHLIIGNDLQRRTATQQRYRNTYNIHWKCLSYYVGKSFRRLFPLKDHLNWSSLTNLIYHFMIPCKF